jgi:hypothetical protein
MRSDSSLWVGKQAAVRLPDQSKELVEFDACVNGERSPIEGFERRLLSLENGGQQDAQNGYPERTPS